MNRLALLVTVAATAGCQAVDIARMEAQQEELQAEYDQLESTVQNMRKEMVDLGIINPNAGMGGGGRAQRTKGIKDHQLPANALADSYPFTVTRTGTPVAMPPLPEMERTESKCGWKFHIPELKPISDFVLNRAEMGKSSPLVLLADGEPQTPHAMPAAFEEACSGAYRHAGFLILFSPKGKPAKAGQLEYAIELAQEVPRARGGDGREMYWLYPGTTLEFAMSEGWDPDWGEMHVDIAGKVIGEFESPVTVKVADEEITVDGTPLEVSVLPDDQRGAWSITLSAPEDGPYVLLDTATIGNSDNALVITSETAFRESKK